MSTPATKVTCDRCSVTSSTTVGFVRVKGGHRCHACVERGSTGRSSWAGRVVLVLSVLVVALTSPDGLLGAVVWFGRLLAVVAASVVVHELGHAVVARLLGFRVLAIQLGAGPRLVRFRLLRTWVSVRASLLGGATVVATDRREAYRLRQSLVVLAGPAASLGLALWALSWDTPTLSSAGQVRIALVVVNLVNVVANLMPMGAMVAGKVAMTDGALLLETLRLDDAGIERRLASASTGEALAAGIDGDHEQAAAVAARVLADDPDDEEAARVLAQELAASRQWEEAIEVSRRVVERTDDPDAAALHRNNLAWSLVMTGDPDRLGEAADVSGLAAAHLGHLPAVAGTRATVLALLGHGDEAMPPLTRARQQRGLTPDDSSMHALAETAIHLEEGRLFEARRALAAVADPVALPHGRQIVLELGRVELANLLDVVLGVETADPAVPPQALGARAAPRTEPAGAAIRKVLSAWTHLADDDEVADRLGRFVETDGDGRAWLRALLTAWAAAEQPADRRRSATPRRAR